MPRGVKYFMDPYQIIKHYTSCPFHKSKRKNCGPGNSSAVVYCFMSEKIILDCEHNALVDAGAQCDIVGDERFKRFRNMSKSVDILDVEWAKKRKAAEEIQEESERVIPAGWSLTLPNNSRITTGKEYDSTSGGGTCGPSNSVLRTCGALCLAKLWLCFWPLALLQCTADETNRCGNED